MAEYKAACRGCHGGCKALRLVAPSVHAVEVCGGAAYERPRRPRRLHGNAPRPLLPRIFGRLETAFQGSKKPQPLVGQRD